MSSPIKISMITVTLNAERTLEKAMDSLINQGYPHLEYIVIDGGSADNTLNIIKKHEKHITYWQSQADKGASQALNIGISKATGELIGFLFADDWLETDILSKIATAYQENPDSDMITCQSRIVKENKNKNQYDVTHIYKNNRSLAINLDNMLFNQPLIANRFINKNLFEKIGKFLEINSNGSDFLSNDREFLIRAALYGVKNTIIKDMGYNYFQHNGSRTLHQNLKTKMEICKEHVDIADSNLRKPLSQQQHKKFAAWKATKLMQLSVYKTKTHQYKNAFCTLLRINPGKYPIIGFELAKKVFKKFL